MFCIDFLLLTNKNVDKSHQTGIFFVTLVAVSEMIRDILEQAGRTENG